MTQNSAIPAMPKLRSKWFTIRKHAVDLHAEQQPCKPGRIRRFVRIFQWNITTLCTRRRNFKDVQSRKIQKTKINIKNLRKDLDHTIKNIPLYNAARNHTHPNCAVERTAVTNYLVDIVKNDGRIPYIVSRSEQDQMNGVDGTRHYYFSKDLSMDYVSTKVGNNHVFIMTDVDYYLDMNKYLKYFKPTLIYTFIPSSAGYRDRETSYFFKDNKVHYCVSGGAIYEHELWDYTGDVITVIDDYKNLLTFDVTQHVIANNPNRRIITILPKVCVPYPYYRKDITQAPLKRKVLNKDGVSFIDCAHSEVYSLAIAGSTEAFQVRKSVYQAIEHRLKTKTSGPPTIADVEQLLHQTSRDDDNKSDFKIMACHLHCIMTKNVEFERNVIATSTLPTHYAPLGTLKTVDSSSPGQAVTSPLAREPALFAAKSLASDEAMTEKRVQAVVNRTRPPVSFNTYREEFIGLVVPPELRHRGSPLPLEEVIALQNKPMQKARTKANEHLFGLYPMNKLKSFMKTEPYPSINDPRAITQMSVQLTIMMSAYTYAFKNDRLKKLPSYGPGKTPAEIVDRIREIGSDGLIESDYSRFDGSISSYLQDVVRRIYLTWVSEENAPILKSNFDSVFIRSATTSHGLKYDAGFGTRSGSPITTDGNTLINMFVSYVALREMGMNKEKAWLKLGLYTGDDGLNVNVPGMKESLELVTKQFGLKLEAVSARPDETVNFAGRTFPHPLTSKSSHQDIKRTLVKLHLSANKNVSRELAAANRAVGYRTTDANTPLIRAWCDMVLRFTGDISAAESMTSEERFKVENGSWNQEDKEIIFDSVCKILGMTRADVEAAERSIYGSKSLDDIPVIYENEREVKLEAEFDGVITGPRDEKCQQTKSNSTSQPKDGEKQCTNTSGPQSTNTSPKPKAGKRRESRPFTQRGQKSTIKQSGNFATKSSTTKSDSGSRFTNQAPVDKRPKRQRRPRNAQPNAQPQQELSRGRPRNKNVRTGRQNRGTVNNETVRADVHTRPDTPPYKPGGIDYGTDFRPVTPEPKPGIRELNKRFKAVTINPDAIERY
jgi:hypothetical protein